MHEPARHITTDAATPAALATASPEAMAVPLLEIMNAVQEAAYVWDRGSDTIHWSRNAATVLGLASLDEISTGDDFHKLIASEHAGARQERITTPQAPSTHVDEPPADERCEATLGSAARDALPTYRLQYRFMPEGRRSSTALWIEDQGSVRNLPGGVTIACGLVRRVDDRRDEDRQLNVLNNQDELTGLMNRPSLKSAIASVIVEAKAKRHTSVFLLAAIDNLTLVNETFGFDVGDEAIRIVGQRLASRLRGGDAIGRFSSNKFGILINDCEAIGLKAVTKRLQQVVSETAIETAQCRFSLTISIGAILVPRDAMTPDDATAGVMQALESAKTMRQENFALFAPNAQLISKRKQNMEISEAVIAAIDEDRMRIALQPIVRTDTHEPAFHECLLRMEMPDGRMESAGYFIPLAEQLGLSRLIDQRVLELTVAQVRRNPKLHVSMNVSGLTATNHAWLVALDKLTGRDRSITQRITVEITETAAIQDLDESVNFVDALKELGCKVAIDDFGAGYTSFRNLKYLGVDMVKIDGAFVKNLKDNADDRVFVTKLSELAAHFGMETVAEWVGDEQSADFLRDIGITYLQGFYFGEPEMAKHTDEPAAVSLVKAAG
ncbi:MAG: GGDEF and EAL domain-containing protein [Pseudomonadota bacterium]